MNEHFAEAVTNTAFLLSLSMGQCNAILRLASDPTQEREASVYVLGVDNFKPLERRGIVYWNHDAQGRAAGFKGLTEVGQLIAKLLVEAGLTIENTNTKMILRRLERKAA